MKLDPFYPIVETSDWIARLVPLGVKLIQLRIKSRPKPEVRHEIRNALAVCREHQAQLVVNDYWDLAIDEGCTFVHLGQEDLEAADLGAIRAAGLKIGLSTHDDAELCNALSARPDYIALGPVYATTLKQMKWAPQGLLRLKVWKSRIGALPLIAIGGLNLERSAGVFEHGADVAAVVTDIVGNQNPESRVREWLAKTESLRSSK